MRIPVAWIDWFDLRRAIVWLLAIGGGYGWLLHHVMTGGARPYALLALAPIVAFVAAPALIALFPLSFRWLLERALAPWQGRYYAFDGRQIRVVEARGRLWFASVDVHAVLGLRRRTAVLRGLTPGERLVDDEVGDALSNEGLARLLARSTDPRVLRFLRWAEHDVRRPWQKKRERVVANETARSSGWPVASGSAGRAAVARGDV